MKLNKVIVFLVRDIIISLFKWLWKYIPQIKEDLAVFIFPAFVAAFVSAVTVSIRTIVQMTLYRMRFHDEQYTAMQKFYPEFEMHLIRLKFVMSEIEYGLPCMKLKIAVKKYIELEKDPEKYFQKYENEMDIMEVFCTAIDDLALRLSEINHFLITNVIPNPPLMHPLLRRKVHKMLAMLQYYAHLWDQYSAGEVDIDVFQKKMMDFDEYWKVNLGCDKMEEYICLLGEWFSKF